MVRTAAVVTRGWEVQVIDSGIPAFSGNRAIACAFLDGPLSLQPASHRVTRYIVEDLAGPSGDVLAPLRNGLPFLATERWSIPVQQHP